jgi:signal transduction histidine kinase
MAHEINNPLGGLFNAIDTLKAHGGRPDVRQRTLALIERGLKGIRDVVRTALVTYRKDDGARALDAADIDDLRLLVEPEIRRRQLVLEWTNGGYEEVPAPASAVRQIVLNLLLNACAATPPGGTVFLAASLGEHGLVVAVGDTGAGMSDAARDVLMGPDRPVAPGTGGLGLWLVRRLVREIGGTVSVGARAPTGTIVEVTIPRAVEEVLSDVA